MHLNAKHIFTIVFITAVFFVELGTKENLKPLSKMHVGKQKTNKKKTKQNASWYIGCPSGCPTHAGFTV